LRILKCINSKPGHAATRGVLGRQGSIGAATRTRRHPFPHPLDSVVQHSALQASLQNHRHLAR